MKKKNDKNTIIHHCINTNGELQKIIVAFYTIKMQLLDSPHLCELNFGNLNVTLVLCPKALDSYPQRRALRDTGSLVYTLNVTFT